MLQEVLGLFANNGILLDGDAAEFVMKQPNPVGFARDILPVLKGTDSCMFNCASLEKATRIRGMTGPQGGATGENVNRFLRDRSVPGPKLIGEPPGENIHPLNGGKKGSAGLPVSGTSPSGSTMGFPVTADSGELAVPHIDPDASPMGGADEPAVEMEEDETPHTGSVLVTETGDPFTSLSKLSIEPLSGYSPRFVSHEPSIEVLRDITGNSLCEGQKEDFFNYFHSRYERMKSVIRGTSGVRNVVPINMLKKGGHFRPAVGENSTVIGMVSDLRTTKKGHTFLELDDGSGSLKALIMNDGRESSKSKLVLDETVALVGNMARDRDLFYVDRVIQPGVPWGRTVNRAEEDVCAVFISDIHAASNTFLQEQWFSFLRWINGGYEEHLDTVNRIKYLVLNGDNVDGIGIYPNHKYDLAISDIYEQYRLLGDYLSRIPEHIRIIMIPGNHDAVRRAEPQPAIVDELARSLPENVTLLGSPSYFKIHGVLVLAYHGTSIDDWITAMNHLTYSNPLKAMMEMMLRRHMLPMYGMKTPLAPEKEDHMIIDPVPDIFITGHTHSFGVEAYRNTLLINGSTWQSQTDYQKLHNFDPVPAKVTVVDLHTMGHIIIDFMDGEPSLYAKEN